MYYLSPSGRDSFYSLLYNRENADEESLKLFGTSRACIDYQTAFLKAEIKNLKKMHILTTCMEDVVCAFSYYIRHYTSLRTIESLFNISATSLVRFEQQLVSILANKWTPSLMIDLTQTPLNKFAFSVPNSEFLGTAAIWDSTLIEVQINGSPDIVKQYIHPHYKSITGDHQTQSMRCIRFGFATLPTHLSLMQLQSQLPNYLENFEEWSNGLPITMEPQEFDPSWFEGLCIGCSDGYLRATHDKRIFEATGIGEYITNGLSLVSDCGLLGQESLLGKTKRNRGSLHIRHRKPKGEQLTTQQLEENGRINSFRKQIEDFNKKFKEFKMFSHKYRNSHNELDNWVKYSVGIINFNLLEKKGLASRLKFYHKDEMDSDEDDVQDEIDSDEDQIDVVSLALREGVGNVTFPHNDQIYISDPYNHRIRKIDQNEMISTIAETVGESGDVFFDFETYPHIGPRKKLLIKPFPKAYHDIVIYCNDFNSTT